MHGCWPHKLSFFFPFLWTAFFPCFFLSNSWLALCFFLRLRLRLCVSFKPLTSFAAINYNYHIKRQSVLIFNYKFFFSPHPTILSLSFFFSFWLCHTFMRVLCSLRRLYRKTFTNTHYQFYFLSPLLISYASPHYCPYSWGPKGSFMTLECVQIISLNTLNVFDCHFDMATLSRAY